ncbi:MAG: hypothetical protein H7338_01265 [Candidatus Sericytochromatia bacterium]|nr:hypothetical protein [Candidatus Sericytochromatia bacterium]
MVIVINPHAHGGTGLKRWRAIAPGVRERWPYECIIPETADEARTQVAEAASRGTGVIIAGGGDGCVNLVLNTIMDPETDAPRWSVAIGALGLGSSNDFHKPRLPDNDVGGVPIKLDPLLGGLVDVGRADWLDPDGEPHTSYFLLNSSLGATAKGNYAFNQASGVQAWLKKVNTNLAIQWGSAAAILQFANVPARMEIDGHPVEIPAISNLGVIKRVYFCGGMRYDTPVRDDDGYFDVNLLAGMDRVGFLTAISAISAGKFLGQPGARHWRAKHVRVIPEQPTVLELDGEVYPVKEVSWRVIPKAVRVCG